MNIGDWLEHGIGFVATATLCIYPGHRPGAVVVLGNWIDIVDTYAFIFYLIVLYTVKVKLKTYPGPLHPLLSNHSSKVLALTPNSSHDLSSLLSIVP